MSLKADQEQPLQENKYDLTDNDHEFLNIKYEFDENYYLVRGNQNQGPDFNAADFSENFNINPTI